MVVFDGVGDDAEHGPLAVRFAPNADTLLERLAAEHRERERVCSSRSDVTVLETAGREVAHLSSRRSSATSCARAPRSRRPRLTDRLDDETRERLERLRRGRVRRVHMVLQVVCGLCSLVPC